METDIGAIAQETVPAIKKVVNLRECEESQKRLYECTTPLDCAIDWGEPCDVHCRCVGDDWPYPPYIKN